jgi:ribosomal protein S18 acetylase RimI-like enzyme
MRLNKNKIEIKKVLLENSVDLLFQLDTAIFVKPKIHLPARNTQDILDYFKKSTIYVAYKDSVPVGYIGCNELEKNTLKIIELGVLPQFQGMGIGSILARYIIGKYSAYSIYLVTHPENAQALHLYQKLGFTITKRIENYYGDGEPRVELALISK